MKKLNKNTIYIAITTLIIGLVLGWLFFGGSNNNSLDTHNFGHSKNQIWTCSMHPQIRQSEPGQCPLCGMDLIPLGNDSDKEYPMEIKMSPTAMKLANVQTAIIAMQKPIKQVRMNGKIKSDETKIFSQSSHIPGRIEKLMVNFTGEHIKQGQILAYVYSPELETAQEELFEAFKIKDSQPALYQAAREKLKNWKLTEKQINRIIENEEIQDQFPILADVSGIVLNKKINLGDYIKKGQSIYDIANLNTVWVLFDVYESDIPWVKIGDNVKFTVPSFPGENFTGKISFIDPIINPKTRVASARVEMNNIGLRLKPDMFVQGIIESPIHKQQEAIVVPKSAVMWTGERSVIYVKNTNAKGVSFIMREVNLGPSLGDSYIIKEGVKEGEEIAVNGTFSIDAAAQLAGKPSMMNSDGGVVMTGHNHGTENNPTTTKSLPQSSKNTSSKTTESKKVKDELEPFLISYLKLKDALVADNFELAISEAKQILLALSKINMGVFTGESHNVWMKHNSTLEIELKIATESKNIEMLRKSFKDISEHTIMIFKTFGSPDETLFIDYCPMADSDSGANWISKEKEIKNPYFGKSMLKCGEVKEKIK